MTNLENGLMPQQRWRSDSLFSRRILRARRMSFNRLDQLLNVNRLGEKSMPVDAEASVRLSPRDERSEENDRRVAQPRIRPHLCRDFASVCLGHNYIEQDQVRLEIPSTLQGLDRVVLFNDQIITCFLQKDFNQVSGVPVIINNQDPPLFLDPGAWRRIRPGKIDVGLPGQEVYFYYLVHTFFDDVVILLAS